MADRRCKPTATLLLDGRVLIAGGCDRDTDLSSTELYDPATGTFTTTGPMSVARDNHTATLLLDGRVLICGGEDDSGEPASYHASAELYDPVTGTFSATGSMADARSSGEATRLQDGRVLIVGGFDGEVFVASAVLYDPLTGTFTATGSMAVPREEHVAVSLLDGRVLVAGGERNADGEPGDLRSAELYDPATGTFAPTGSMVRGPEKDQVAVLLLDGRVLVAGGDDGDNTLDAAELYDPATDTFTPTAPMTDPRRDPAAVLLLDGRVLVVGGDDGDDSLASAELFDPQTNTFTATGSMADARRWPAAVALADGRALVVGGWDETRDVLHDSAEIFE